METSDQKKENRIKTIIAEFGVKYHYSFPNNLTETHSLNTDLGLDSLGILELCMCIESDFGISIHQDDVDSFKTIGDIINYLKKLGF